VFLGHPQGLGPEGVTSGQLLARTTVEMAQRRDDDGPSARVAGAPSGGSESADDLARSIDEMAGRHLIRTSLRRPGLVLWMEAHGHQRDVVIRIGGQHPG
jgi:hypothetical protein